MLGKRKKAHFLFFLIIVLVIFITPSFLAAGSIQGKIRQKIESANKNVQYQTEQFTATSTQQYEPYYSDTENAPAMRHERSQQVTINRDSKDQVPQYAQEQIGANRQVQAGEPAIRASYVIYKTIYQAEIDEDVVTVRGNVVLEVFRKGINQIPLVRSDVGLIDLSTNRGAAFVVMQGGKYYLVIDQPGRYNLDIEFLIKAGRERENGPGSFNLDLVSAPISQFEFTMPEEGVDIFVEPSIRVETKRLPKKTIAWAIMPNTNNITVRWTKALPKETITPVKLEPKIYVDTSTYAAIGEGIIRCYTDINYSILQSEVSNFRLALPEDVSVLEVKSKDIRDWKVSSENGTQYVDVYLNFGVKGNYAVSLNYERKIGEGSGVVQVPQVKAVGAEREKGYFGIAAATNVELAINKLEHASVIDVKELPSMIWSSSVNPILLALKYLSHPFSIAVDVTKHEEVPVLVSAIDRANYISLQTQEGKDLTKAVYQIRNNVKQFMHLDLPKDATLWSVFVAGKPAKPAKDNNGSILIPLEKSQLSGESLTQFPVEIVYLSKLPKMSFLGWLDLNLPKVDIPISSLYWAVYLPREYLYFNFGGDVQQVSDGGFEGAVFDRVVSMKRASEEMVGSQFAPRAAILEEEQSGWSKGVLPIKIDVPQEGRLYSFSKLLVTENESPKLSFKFIRVAKVINRIFKIFILLILLFIAFKVLRRIIAKPRI